METERGRGAPFAYQNSPGLPILFSKPSLGSCTLSPEIFNNLWILTVMMAKCLKF